MNDIFGSPAEKKEAWEPHIDHIVSAVTDSPRPTLDDYKVDVT